MNSYIRTSEYVSPGHSDKIADQISDTILDAYLSIDRTAKVACETMVKNNNVYIGGEISSIVEIPESKIQEIVRETICEIGYDRDEFNFNGNNCSIHIDISSQSPEIREAIACDDGVRAGDQGIMFGYATNETPNFMPLPIYLAKYFVTTAYDRKDNYQIRPDMKSQVSIRYENASPIEVDTVVVSMCHDESIDLEMLRQYFHDVIKSTVIREAPEHIGKLFTENTKWYVNPAGAWNTGGPATDCGLTGRKIVVDQYGGDCPVGGGAFSGKDPSKVDRSGAYMARHIALNTLVNNPEAGAIQVQLGYVIGQTRPVSLRIHSPYNGNEYALENINLGDLTPSSIIAKFELDNPIYKETARYGHFGMTPKEVEGTKFYQWENIE
jgi:S-adenosylmethionine synthetase